MGEEKRKALAEKRAAEDAAKEAARLKAKEERMKQLLQQQKSAEETRKASIAKDSANFEEKRRTLNLPATFRTLRRALVREGESFESKKAGELERYVIVTVEEVIGNRARISAPMIGWVTVITKKGLLIDLQTENIQAYPMLGATQVSEIAKVSFTAMQKAKKKEKESAKKKKVSKRDQTRSCASSDSGSSTSKKSYKKPYKKVKKAKEYVKINTVDADGFNTITKKSKRRMLKIESGKWYRTTRAAVVRRAKSKNSVWRGDLYQNTRVYVVTVDHEAGRAQISAPCVGWISIVTSKGSMLK